MRTVLTAFICAAFLFACKGPAGEKAKVTDAQDIENTTASSTYQINTASSEVTWQGFKPGDSHNGTIKLTSGSINMDGESIVGGEFVIDMSTITATDADLDEEGNTKLTGHLRSADFFHVDSLGTSMFEITKVVELKDSDLGSHSVYGNLTMNGITKNVQFPANIACVDNTCTTMAEFNIDRTNWGIEFMSKKILGELADRFVNDEITIGLNIVSSK